MARKKGGSRRGRSNFVVLKVNTTFTLGALADNTIQEAALIDITGEMTLIGADLTWTLRDLTPGEGPVQVGLNHSIYNAAEIVEALDASPRFRGDMLALEKNSRKVREIGAFSGLAEAEVLNNGLPVRTSKMYWKFEQDTEPEIWAMNRSGSTLTTGSRINVTGVLYARWN